MKVSKYLDPDIIKDGSLDGNKIKDSSIDGNKIKDSSIDGNKIKDGSLDGNKKIKNYPPLEKGSGEDSVKQVNCDARGYRSHAEGDQTTASGNASHAEGAGTKASAHASHAEGSFTTASGEKSHAEGDQTTASNSCEHAEGKYNLSIKDKTIHTVGIGSLKSGRKNAHEIHKDGKHYIYGIGGYDGTNSQTEGVKTLQEELTELESKIGTCAPFKKGNADNSVILKGEYQGYKNKAISQTSVAIGAATTAGLKGWYYSNIDFTNKKITLSDKPTYITVGTILINGGWSSGTPNIEVGDVISLVNNRKYDLCSKVTSVDGNVITVDSLPFTALVQDSGAAAAVIAGQFSDGYSVYIPDRPDAGIIDFGGGAFSEGAQSKASNICTHAEGLQTHAYGQYSHTEGRETKAGYIAHAEGSKSKAIGNASHTEGTNTQALNSNTHAEGYNTEVKGYAGHAEGYFTKVLADYGHAEGDNTEVSIFSRGAHAEGVQTKASNLAAHAEGFATKALGTFSHAEGCGESLDNPNLAQGDYSHVEGEKNKALGIAAHSEGGATVATGNFSHSEGRFTRAHGLWSHVEGGGVEGDEDNYGAFGPISHCEGYATKTYSDANSAHAEGRFTEASNMAEHACGIYNKSTKSSDASQATHFSIGIGTSNTNRKNAVEVKQNGDVYIIGIGGYDETNSQTKGIKTVQQVINFQAEDIESIQEVITSIETKINDENFGGILCLNLGNTMDAEHVQQIVNVLQNITQNQKHYIITVYDTTTELFMSDVVLFRSGYPEYTLISNGPIIHDGEATVIELQQFIYNFNGNGNTYTRETAYIDFMSSKAYTNLSSRISALENIIQQITIMKE